MESGEATVCNYYVLGGNYTRNLRQSGTCQTDYQNVIEEMIVEGAANTVPFFLYIVLVETRREDLPVAG